MAYFSCSTQINTHLQILFKMKVPAVVVIFFVFLIPRLWADNQKEYIYLEGKVVAVESTATQASNCTYSISSANASFTSSGGSGSVSVSSQNGCTWTTTNNASSWVTITGGASGTGGGTVSYTVAANTGAQRTGTIIIADKTFTITQAAPAPVCTYNISPTSASPAAGGGSGSVSVTTSNGCSWTATSNVSWITTSASGTSGGSAGYLVAANTGPARSGTINVAGNTFTVNQANGCTYSLSSPSSGTISVTGGSGSFTVNASNSACGWTASKVAAWITITSGTSGTGTGTVGYSVSTNSSGPRSSKITAGGKDFTVSQDGLTCQQVCASNKAVCEYIAYDQQQMCLNGCDAQMMGCIPYYSGYCEDAYENCASGCSVYSMLGACESAYNQCVAVCQ